MVQLGREKTMGVRRGLRPRKRMGPLSSAPGGYGTINIDGYRRVSISSKGKRRQRFEHRVVWEQYNGPVPKGYEIHHRDGNRLNNAIENLEMVTPLAHKRLHEGCFEKDGVQWKPCRKCGTPHPVDTYYKRKTGILSICRSCEKKRVSENKRKRKQKTASAGSTLYT